MLLDEEFDADEILRDIGDEVPENEDCLPEGTRELNFGTVRDEKANFREIAEDLELGL